MSNTFVWVDIPVRDLDRAIAFYSAVLGCAVKKEIGPGFTFGLFSHSGADVAGCLYVAGPENAPSPTGPLVYVNVQGRLGQALAAVTHAGGQVLQAEHQIGPHGWRALVVDSEGNRLALHSPTG